MNESESELPLLGGLYDLKNWLTLDEAANLLTQSLKQETTAADLLRLGLDGRLMLSVRFVNHLLAKQGRLVPRDQAEHEEIPASDGEPVRLAAGQRVELANGDVINLDCEIVHLFGVLDLPAFSQARLWVESEYQATLPQGQRVQVTDGNLEGFVVSFGDTYFLLQQEEVVVSPDVPPGWKWPKTYRERLTMPDDARIVIRPAALRRMLGDLSKEVQARDAARAELEQARKWGNNIVAERDALLGERDSLRAIVDKMAVPGERAEATYLNIIGAMLELLRNPRPGREESDAAVIRELIDNYGDKPGISKTTLEARFAEARRRLSAT